MSKRKYKICFFAAAILVFILNGITGIAEYEPPYRIVSYAYKSLDGFDASLVTNVHYAFADISDGRILLDDTDAQNLADLCAMKAEYPKLKVVLAVGGGSRSYNFSETAAMDESRQIFAQSCLEAVEEYQLDGIDIDWEYPTNGMWGKIPSSPEDKHNFTLLLQEIRNALGNERIVSSTIGSYMGFQNDIELESICEIVDYVSIMNYDFASSSIRHDANLYASDFMDSNPKCGDWSVKTCISNGVDASKIMFGIPFYGRNSSTAISYKKLKADYINKNGYTRYWDDTAKAAYLINGDEIISYEDEESIACKADYIKENGLGGAMYWACANDDTELTLSKAVFNGLLGANDPYHIEITDTGNDICVSAPYAEEGAVLIAVIYDENRISEVKMSQVADSEDNALVLRVNKDNEKAVLKAFLWDGLNTMRPLAEAAVSEE